MMLVQLVVLAGLLEGCVAIMCHDDFTLDNLKEYTYDLPKEPTAGFWNKYTPKKVGTKSYNLHFSYNLFGKFDGDASDATISVGYEKEDGSVISSVTVDCGAGKWTSYAPTAGDPTTPEQFQEGDLEDGSCVNGDIFDVILKTHQAHLMNWLYKGQPLQKGKQTTYLSKEGKMKIPRERPLYVPSPDEERPQGGGTEAAKFVVKTTGSAVITRIAFGRCIVWPEEITNSCSEVNEYLMARSKGDPTADGGEGIYGSNNFIFKMTCIENDDGSDSDRYLWLQERIHPNEKSTPGSAICCCVNMVTGKVFDDDPDTNCASCRESNNDCMIAFDDKLLPEEFFD